MSLAAAFSHHSPALRPAVRSSSGAGGRASVPSLKLDNSTRNFPPASWSCFPPESLVPSGRSRAASGASSPGGYGGTSTPPSTILAAAFSATGSTAAGTGVGAASSAPLSLPNLPVDSREAQQVIDSSPLLRPLAHLNLHSRHNSSPSAKAFRQVVGSAPTSANARAGGWSPTHQPSSTTSASAAAAANDSMLLVPSNLPSTAVSATPSPRQRSPALAGSCCAGELHAPHFQHHQSKQSLTDTDLMARVFTVGTWPSHLLSAHSSAFGPMAPPDMVTDACCAAAPTGCVCEGDNAHALVLSSSECSPLVSRQSSGGCGEHVGVLSPLLLPPSPFELKFNLEELRTLRFDCWRFSEEELLLVSYAIFEDAGLIAEFGLQPDVLQCFLLNVRARYRSNPYHNFYHGLSVLQCGYMMLRSTRANAFLPKLEHLALLVACLCHDVDHPGTTNQFQVNCASELALMHNDQAVLENHHAKETFSLLRDPSANIFSPLSTRLTQAHVRTLRKRIILAILATDMQQHYACCKRLDALAMERQTGTAGGGAASDKTLQSERDEDRQFVLDVLVHGSDLSGQVYPLPIAQQWEARVTEEFSQQAQLEQALGLPVAPFMLDLDQDVVRLKNHLGFLDFVLQPLWRGLADLFPELQPCMSTLQENRKFFADRFTECEEKQKQQQQQEHVSPTAGKRSISSTTSSPVPEPSALVPPAHPVPVKIVPTLQAFGSDTDSDSSDDDDDDSSGDELEVVVEAQQQ